MKEDSTREKIMSAAKEVFSSKGYTRATTKEISKVASVAEVTIFRHFETKNNLFYETICKYLVNSLLNFKTLNSYEDMSQTILNITQERINTLRENKDLFICTIYEAQFNDEIKNILQKIYSKVFNTLMLYIKSNEEKVNDIKVDHIAQLFLSTIVGIIILETLGDTEEFIDSNKLIETIKTLILN